MYKGNKNTEEIKMDGKVEWKMSILGMTKFRITRASEQIITRRDGLEVIAKENKTESKKNKEKMNRCGIKIEGNVIHSLENRSR
jgi:hypothetical protein